jgi:hypothetical protein
MAYIVTFTDPTQPIGHASDIDAAIAIVMAPGLATAPAGTTYTRTAKAIAAKCGRKTLATLRLDTSPSGNITVGTDYGIILATITVDRVLITGDTYAHRASLAAMGGVWDSREKGWYVPADSAASARALVGTPKPRRPRLDTSMRSRDGFGYTGDREEN